MGNHMGGPLKRISSADLVRNFPLARETAAKRPIAISNHGRDTHVLLTKADYDALVQGAGGGRMDFNPVAEFGDWMTDSIILCDRDLKIVHLNRNAEAILRRSSGELTGIKLASLPEVAGTPMLSLIERTNLTNEPAMVEIQSPFAKESWLRFRCFPWRDWNVVLFRDITDRVEAQKLAQSEASLLEAMEEHGSICCARLSVRGSIALADQPFSELVGLPKDRFIGTPLTNLVASPDRAKVRDAIEATIQHGARHRLLIDFISNHGETVRTTAGLAPLTGAYATDGAVLILTPAHLATIT